MCNCLKQIEKTTTDYIKKDVESNFTVSEWTQPGRFVNTGYPMNGSGVIKIGMPFSYEYVRQKKDGSPERKSTKKEVIIYPSYCPFCGEKYPEE